MRRVAMFAAPEDTNVNVVVFLIDALRADRLGVYGYERPTSPEIDDLARESVVFSQAYAPAPWTIPSLASLMTSTFPCEHGQITGLFRDDPDHEVLVRLDSSLETLAERLQRGGFATVSLFANALSGDKFGLERGFDIHRAVESADGEELGRVLDEGIDEPFFLFVHNTETHDPYPAPEDIFSEFGTVSARERKQVRRAFRDYRAATRVDFRSGRPPGTTDNTGLQDDLKAYLSEHHESISIMYDSSVRFADRQLGSVVRLLKERGLWSNTLFILLADHGEEFGEHGGWQHDQSVYEELLRVPLIIHFPGGVGAGRRVTTVVSLVDVGSTIVEYLGGSEAETFGRGRNLLPLMEAHSSEPTSGDVIPGMRVNRKKYYRPFKESRGDLNVVIRRGTWKGIWNAELESLELYELSIDPFEREDLAARYPKLAEELADACQDWLTECRERYRTRVAGKVEEISLIDEATRRNLLELGYISDEE